LPSQLLPSMSWRRLGRLFEQIWSNQIAERAG
jgi:hypothetical protein